MIYKASCNHPPNGFFFLQNQPSWNEKCIIYKTCIVPQIRILTQEQAMNDILNKMKSVDNGGRRSGGDRRNYSYTLHIPERRTGKDRRSGEDRRKSPRIRVIRDNNEKRFQNSI